jgi:MFS transporter, DHA1 family, multidrug resistance protein
MTLPLFPLYFHSINLSAIDIGLVYAAYGISFLVFEALWGFVFDRFGIKGSVPLIAVVLTSVAIFLFSRPASLAEVIGIEVLWGNGLGGAGVFPRVAVAHFAKYADRGRAFGMLGLTYSIGASFGSLIGGVSGAVFGSSPSFIIAAVITVASTLPVWLGNRPSKDEVIAVDIAVQPSGARSRFQAEQKLKLIGIIVLGLVGLTAASGNGFFSLLFPNILAKEPKFLASPVEVGGVLFIYSLSSGIFQPFLGSLGSRKPRSWIMGGLAATGVCYLALTLTQNVAQVDLVTLILGVAYSTITPLTLSLLTASVPRGFWGRIMGLYGAAEDVGILVGSSLGSFIWGFWGFQYSFIMMGSIFILVGAVCAIATKKGKLG